MKQKNKEIVLPDNMKKTFEKMKESGDIPETFMDRPTSAPTTKPKKESGGNDFINFFTGGGKEEKPPEPYSLKFIMKT